MDPEDVQSLVEDLEGNIDDLESALAPIVKTALSASTSKLPLLDKAKLYVLATYSIESILFSALRLRGVDAKAHPVFQELSRVKEYFEKIKAAEGAGTKRSTQVDKDAAGRFIKHGLAGNEKYDKERAERVEREKAGAKRKLEALEGVGKHTRFDGAAKRIRAAEGGEAGAMGSDGPETMSAPSGPRSAEEEKAQRKEAKRQRRQERKMTEPEAVDGSAAATPSEEAGTAATSRRSKSSTAPRSSNQTFQALLEGPLPQAEESKGKKKKRKSRGQMRQEMEDERAEEMR